MKSLPLTIFTSFMLALWPAGLVLADDGETLRRDISKTPELTSEHAAIRILPLYVPAQTSAGVLITDTEEGSIEYWDKDGTLVEERYEARPLVAHYSDGLVEHIEEEGYGGFPGHGKRDAWGAVSLDDGQTWKKTNLSKSGDQSSIRVKDGKRKVAYPGDVGRSFMASDGNKVLVIWVSRYARGGNPNYAIPLDTGELEQLADLLILRERIDGEDRADCIDGEDDGGLLTPCLYLEDHFGVSGSQGLSDLADEDLPLIGELPYAAVWVARGVILPPAADGELSRFFWFKAERLTSAVRDANRPEAVCVKGAGCVVTWQEDPEGIRPGHGDGPGEGWSGAIAHHQTDTWYSYIHWDDFDLVADDDTATAEEGYGSLYNGTGLLSDWALDNELGGSPQAAIPMAMPVRLTDNAMCTGPLDEATPLSKIYCHVDFNENGTPDFCDHTVPVTIETPVNPEGEITEMCVAEDGRLMRGNTASTRARLGLHGYSTDGVYDPANPDTYPINSAWFHMAYEENKGLGDLCDDGDCPLEEMTEADKRDMGKNVWYHTFDMFNPELVSQGLMLNQPAVYPDEWENPAAELIESVPLSGYNMYAFITDPIYEDQAGITTTTLYQTEISRRPSKISQNWYDAGPSGLVGLQLWKQGIIRRGGPADVFGRRFVMPVGDAVTLYKWCEDSGTSEWCRTVFDYCTAGECEANIPNEVFGDLNKGQCKKYPDDPRCFEYYYIDPVTGETIYTHDAENCSEEPVCYTDMASCPDGVDCQEDTLCESVAQCPADLGVDGTCVAEEVCFTEPECPADTDCEEIITSGVDHTLNPYDYANMECLDADGNSAWYFTEGENARYVKGLCAAPAINLSGTTVLTGEQSYCTDAVTCLDAFPFNAYFDDLYMVDAESISKILTWQQYGPDYGGAITVTDPYGGDSNNLNDLSWENPYDVAKGHRGFMTGDMVMVMYAASPNWKALTDAHAIFNLYNRRSFDGGVTWSTLPGGWTHTNGDTYDGKGTTTCEWMVTDATTGDQVPVCTDYIAGAFEQARNVSQLTGSQVTVLDPRYAPTARSITEESVSTYSLPEGFIGTVCDGTEEVCDDLRDPSRYFMVYETGHTAAYDEGEATPLDLFYSRAVEWGDQYLVYQDEDTYVGTCLPAADQEDDYADDVLAGFCNEFDSLEGWHDSESGEASVAASPGGQFFYAVWNQEDLDSDHEVIKSDVWFRRVLFLDGYVPEDDETQ